MMENNRQDIINARNRTFWNEPCGTNSFLGMELKEYSVENLKKYDDWYMSFYHYLYTHIPFAEMRARKVLEIGLGMGTISQKIAESGAVYHGLDIAEKPVELVKLRLEQNKLPGEASVGNILESGIPDGSFDFVVAIGCYHHTGNLQKAIDETYRILNKGGKAIIMVYNAYSYRQWLTTPRDTARLWLREFVKGESESLGGGDEAKRRMYDFSSSGAAAAETVFTSRRQFRRMASKFSSIKIRGENVEAKYIFKYLGRNRATRLFGNMLGLDIYCTCVK